MQELMMVMVVLLIAAVAAAPAQEESLVAGELERVATGLQFTEGPAWHPDGYLVFSDIPADTIYRLGEKGPEVYRRPSGNSNGLIFDRNLRLVACEHGNRRVSLTGEDGVAASLASQYEGKRLNSPNDLVEKSDGSVYFTDPPYGVRAEQRELDFQGVFRIGPDGKLTLAVRDFAMPNGLAFSPDEKVLYVADTEKDCLRAFDVKEDGSLANDRVFIRTERPERLGADGIKVDVKGNVYITAYDGVWIVSPKGEHLETIRMEERPANLAFGDADGRTLYVTARKSVYKVRVKHAGAAVARRPAEGAGD